MEIDLYSSEITNDILDDIYINIDQFCSQIKQYKKILMICSDYPGYGGAATNCLNIQHFLQKNNHIVFSLFYFDDYDFSKNKDNEKEFKVVKLRELSYYIKNNHFIPDLIIFKNFINFNIKNIFDVPVIYLIAGIYKNNLDKNFKLLKTRNEHDKYINPFVLKQIKESDKSFCNSSHTQKILKEIYNINTDIFYSSFVPYYKKSIYVDSNWNNRTYDYAFISSNFNREIKNIKDAINFLIRKKNDKNNILLIGECSSLYKEHGFKCIELVPKDKMKDYYKQIKYIYQNSNYESCSNVKVEGSFFGCKIISS